MPHCVTRLAAGIIALVLLTGPPHTAASAPELPNKAGSVKFAVIGDNGTGSRAQYELAEQMVRARGRFAFDFVLMLGDNFYGRQRPADLVDKFERPYKPLIDAGVTFHAAIGNHDEPHTVNYAPLNMGGQRYYTYTRPRVRFFVLDTNSLEPKQVAWFAGALETATEDWKIAYFHHPLYSNAGRHGSNTELRLLLEPLLLKHGVSVVFAGHDHIYERLVPQKGITHFVSGSGGQLRRGDLQRSASSAAGYDQDQTFMLVEIDGNDMSFEAISRTGTIVDSGVVRRPARTGTE
jgi:hypothetical protein